MIYIYILNVINQKLTNEFKKTKSSIEVPKAFCCGRFNKFIICTFVWEVCVVVAGCKIDATVVAVGAVVVVVVVVVVGAIVVVVGAIVVVLVVVVGAVVVVLVIVVGAIVVVVVVIGANVVVVVLLVEIGVVDVMDVVTDGGGIVPMLPFGTPITLENGVKTSTYGLIGRGKAGLFDSIVSSWERSKKWIYGMKVS